MIESSEFEPGGVMTGTQFDKCIEDGKFKPPTEIRFPGCDFGMKVRKIVIETGLADELATIELHGAIFRIVVQGKVGGHT